MVLSMAIKTKIKYSYYSTKKVYPVFFVHVFTMPFFPGRTLSFSPSNVCHFASQRNQSTVTTKATLRPLKGQPESAVMDNGKDAGNVPHVTSTRKRKHLSP